MTKRDVHANVWDALEDVPAERERLKIRSILLSALESRIKSWRITQAEAAKRLGINQPRLNDLVRHRFNNFSLEALFDLATRAGIRIELKIDGRVKKAA